MPNRESRPAFKCLTPAPEGQLPFCGCQRKVETCQRKAEMSPFLQSRNVPFSPKQKCPLFAVPDPCAAPARTPAGMPVLALGAGSGATEAQGQNRRRHRHPHPAAIPVAAAQARRRERGGGGMRAAASAAVDLWTSPADRRAPFGACGQPVDTRAPLAHNPTASATRFFFSKKGKARTAKRGHFNFGDKGTFQLCVDTSLLTSVLAPKTHI